MTISLVRYQVAERVLAQNPPVAKAAELLPLFGDGSKAYRMLDRMLDEGVLVRRSHGFYGLGDIGSVLLPRGSALMSKVLEHLLDNDCEEGLATPVIAEGAFDATDEVRERLRRAAGKGLAEVVSVGGGNTPTHWRASKALRDAHARVAQLREAARVLS